MDKLALKRLKRPALQRISKREGINARGKNSTMIERLIAKYPGGVPMQNDLSTSLKEKSPVIKAEYKGDESDSFHSQSKRPRLDVNSGPPHIGSVSERAARWVEEVAGADPPLLGAASSIVPADVRGSTAPGPKDNRSTHQPSVEDMKYIKGELTHLVNSRSHIHAELSDIQELLERATSILYNASEDFKEIFEVQKILRLKTIEMFKNDRRVWDGSHLMLDDDFDKWNDFLEELGKEEYESTVWERTQLEEAYNELLRRREEGLEDEVPEDDDVEDDDDFGDLPVPHAPEFGGEKRKRGDDEE